MCRRSEGFTDVNRTANFQTMHGNSPSQDTFDLVHARSLPWRESLKSKQSSTADPADKVVPTSVKLRRPDTRGIYSAFGVPF